MKTIYLDVLFCVNFVIDYIILLTVRRFMDLRVRKLRLLAGAAVGGLTSFVILLPAMPSGLSLIFSLAFAFAVAGTAFAPMPRGLFIKTSAAFFLISFGYSGLMLAILLIFSPESLIIRNGSVYIGISPMVLLVTTVFCYVILRVILRLTGRGGTSGASCTLRISSDGKTTEYKALVDTGSSLREPFSGKPVIIVSEQAGTQGGKGMRLVPFSSVGGEGLLRAYYPDRITAVTNDGERSIDGYIAASPEKLREGVEAVIPAFALE